MNINKLQRPSENRCLAVRIQMQGQRRVSSLRNVASKEDGGHLSKEGEHLSFVLPGRCNYTPAAYTLFSVPTRSAVPYAACHTYLQCDMTLQSAHAELGLWPMRCSLPMQCCATAACLCKPCLEPSLCSLPIQSCDAAVCLCRIMPHPLQVRGQYTVLHKDGEPASARFLALVPSPALRMIVSDVCHQVTRHAISSESLCPGLVFLFVMMLTGGKWRVHVTFGV